MRSWGQMDNAPSVPTLFIIYLTSILFMESSYWLDQWWFSIFCFFYSVGPLFMWIFFLLAEALSEGLFFLMER